MTTESKPKEPPSETLLRIAKHIQSRRLQKELTQEKLAEMTGLSRVFIQRVEHDAENLSIDSADKIAHALGCELRDLL